MSLEGAFLSDIVAHPADDAPRLVYADWLEEQGDPARRDRAELIRAQIEREGLPELCARRWELERREAALLATYREQWVGPVRSLVPGWEFRRGFVGQVTCPPQALIDNADRLFAAAPLQRLQIRLGPGVGVNSTLRALRPLVRLRQLRQVVGLDLDVSLTRKTAELFAKADTLANLRELHLSQGDRFPRTMPALLAAPFVPRLTTLRLAGEMCHEALVALPSARALVSLAELSMRGLGLNAPFLLSAALPLPGLRTLDLSFFAHPLWDARRLHTVLASPLAARVEEVRLAIPGHGRVVHSWWLEAPPSPLRWLDLSNHGFLPEDAVTLANSPSFARLEHLNLRGNILESAGVVPLARSPHFAQLRALLLHFNGIGDEGAVELARSPSMANLLWLDLTANRLTDRAGFALANSPILTNLARLDIQRNDFSDRARQALVDRFGAGVAL